MERRDVGSVLAYAFLAAGGFFHLYYVLCFSLAIYHVSTIAACALVSATYPIAYTIRYSAPDLEPSEGNLGLERVLPFFGLDQQALPPVTGFDTRANGFQFGFRGSVLLGPQGPPMALKP